MLIQGTLAEALELGETEVIGNQCSDEQKQIVCLLFKKLLKPVKWKGPDRSVEMEGGKESCFHTRRFFSKARQFQFLLMLAQLRPLSCFRLF